MRALRRFVVRAALPEPLAALGDLVMNLRWTWHAPTLDVFAAIDPATWAAVEEDPLRLLGEVSTARLAELAGDPAFGERLRAAAADLRSYLTADRWYQQQADAPASIAYFSPEFGLTKVLPQYSGGLGILAGDHLKAASDLGVPVIGVGLLYRRGYFRQSLSADGWQLERYPPIDPNGLPLTLLRGADGSPLQVVVGLPGGRALHAQVWQAQVGRVPLLLLDSDVESNEPPEREVTDRLYGGGTEHRLQQEMLLGIGGVRALRAFCAATGTAVPEVFHTNEGHAGFLGLERIRELVAAGLDFDEALTVVRAGTVFTTHTPVPAGIDRFPVDLVRAYFGGDNACPGVPVDRVCALGAEPDGDPAVFNMAVMGLRLAQRANGVSRLHGEVSRAMFAGLWPGFDVEEVPISSVTNGVHAHTWVAREVLAVAGEVVGPALTEEGREWDGVRDVADEAVWATRRVLRARLVDDVRRRLADSWRQRGATDAELRWVAEAFDPDVLTVGFARRVPSYKRLTLMLHDPDRLRALLTDPQRPVQIVVAGKAHPADDGGKALVQQIVRFADDPAVRHRIAFLPDYDMGLAASMVAGCDVWLNNPLRPLEACGTSGMKSALNGGLNLSIRDGWWDELFDGENGWAIPSADGLDADRRDALEADALYELLESSVRVRFYDTDATGLPRRWVEMVRHTLVSLGPSVLASRMVRDYVDQLYRPAAGSSRRLSADGARAGRELAAWVARVRAAWPGVQVVHVETAGIDDAPQVGAAAEVHASVQLGALTPADVTVQVVYGRVDGADRIVAPASVELAADGETGTAVRYRGTLPLARTGPFGYAVRVLPRHRLLSSPVELGLVSVAVEATDYVSV